MQELIRDIIRSLWRQQKLEKLGAMPIMIKTEKELRFRLIQKLIKLLWV